MNILLWLTLSTGQAHYINNYDNFTDCAEMGIILTAMSGNRSGFSCNLVEVSDEE